MIDIKSLFVWTLASVKASAPTDLNTEKTICFVPFDHLDPWIITHRIQDNNIIPTIVRIYLFLVSISFAYTSRNPVSMQFHANTSDKNLKPIYVIKRTSNLCLWML